MGERTVTPVINGLFLLHVERNQPKQRSEFQHWSMYLPILWLIIMQRTASGRDYLTTSHARSENKWLDRITIQTVCWNSSFKFHDCVTPVCLEITFPFGALLTDDFMKFSIPCWLYLSEIHRKNEQWSRIILWSFCSHYTPKRLRRTAKFTLFSSVKTEIKRFSKASFKSSSASRVGNSTDH